ncbi:hypothetical protein [Halostagnicola sp. A-GB9-2]|uniref:hypothetical protein n=1 Tax=Halostagnicola sp. A-GB9-2 TaxID=3048066 RepID=UPI0024C0500A|nr:hypothetical protein [Halostagnicola sp. A-GB9-2]MDJ1432401.1 hypothetical protein [Halostagnicola sp. A-GB9-2]
MTEHTSTSASETVADRFDRTMPALSPAVRTIAFDALEPVDHSLPVALCQTTAAAASSERPPEQMLEAITVAIEALQGYVQLRSQLLEHDRYTSSADRDAAILAGDYLHAFAHASIGDLSADDAQQLELFRVFTSGSNALSRAYLEPSSGLENSGIDRYRRAESQLSESVPAVSAPDAILAGIAAELGATAVDATETVRESIRTYGYSLSRALAIASLESSSSSDESPHSIAIRVLSSRTASDIPGGPPTASPDELATGTGRELNYSEPIERELEYARTALETVYTVEQSAGAAGTLARTTETDAGSGDDSGSVTPRQTGRSPSDRPEEGRTERADPRPRERLERATRIPFDGVLVSNE